MLQNNTKNFFWVRMLVSFLPGLMITAVYADTPLLTFEPLTDTTIAIPANLTTTMQYRITNQSSQIRTLVMKPIQGIMQTTTGLNVCANPFVLRSKSSCILSLQTNGKQLDAAIGNGPEVCQEGAPSECYRPSTPHILRITQTMPITDAVITTTESPLMLTMNVPAQLTINNTSTQVSATNISSNFTETTLDGNVREISNTCADIPPGGSCTLTYIPGNIVAPPTNFSIQGTNTNVLKAAIAIQSGSTLTAITPNFGTAAGGVNVSLTGTGLIGATGVTIDGIAATDVHVLNSRTMTAVLPVHAAGVVDVVIDTPSGGATLNHGYTYVPMAVGQPSGGGTIACLNGGLYNLIVTTTDTSSGIRWGAHLSVTKAQSDTDGAANTKTIVTFLGNKRAPYAAQLCNDYEVDSQGHTPCQAGNTCYNDWFLPAIDQLKCLYTHRVVVGGFTHRYYSSSTEDAGWAKQFAILQSFIDGSQFGGAKDMENPVRCVRAFTA